MSEGIIFLRHTEKFIFSFFFSSLDFHNESVHKILPKEKNANQSLWIFFVIIENTVCLT